VEEDIKGDLNRILIESLLGHIGRSWRTKRQLTERVDLSEASCRRRGIIKKFLISLHLMTSVFELHIFVPFWCLLEVHGLSKVNTV
jgi:hypothetical protein